MKGKAPLETVPLFLSPPWGLEKVNQAVKPSTFPSVFFPPSRPSIVNHEKRSHHFVRIIRRRTLTV